MAKRAPKVKPVEVRWLIESGRISPMSPIALITDRLRIEWLMMFDDEYIYGPTPGLVEVADVLIRVLKPKSIIDLFGGSGALSKLAVRSGVKNVTYVDLYPDAAVLNLRDVKGGLKIVRADAFNFLEKKIGCDVLFADPPEELINKFLNFHKRLREIFRKAALIWIGSSESSMKRVKALRNRRMTEIVSAWGDVFAILWKPGLSSKIKKVRQMLE